MIEINAGIVGQKELDEALKQLPKALQKQVLVAGLKKVAEPVRDQAKQGVPVEEGGLRDSIEISTRARKVSRSPYPVVYVGPSWPKGAHGHLVEFGTSRHDIAPAKKREKGALRFEIGGETIYAKKVNHPGTKARAFLRPAWDLNSFRIPGELGKILWDLLVKKARTLARKAEKGTLGASTRRQLRAPLR